MYEFIIKYHVLGISVCRWRLERKWVWEIFGGYRSFEENVVFGRFCCEFRKKKVEEEKG